MDRQALEEAVRKTVYEVLAKSRIEVVASPATEQAAGGREVILVRGTETGLQKFEPVPGVNARLTDLVNADHGASMAVGLMEVRECTFDWTLNYEEIEYVLEGTLDIIADGKTIRGYKGDAIYIPKGTHIQFSSPDRALFLYCTYPADWANQ
ncbi:MAG TPA: cupin domain-containing protein [Symbiobacteriaceae bacterium]|jgi:ethanolamine utilization protein EutQ